MSSIRLLSLVVLFSCCMALAVMGATEPEGQDSTAGFIYGTVTWPSGETLTGFLRWEDEEAFWDDLFHSGQRELPWFEYVDTDQLQAERRDAYYESHGLLHRLIYAMEEDGDFEPDWRVFLIRFGDIQSIEIHDGEDDFVITADGSRHEVGGYANDAGSDLLIYHDDGEPRETDWNDLVEIRFAPVPPGSPAYAERLHGLVETGSGDFEGYIQWDKSENLSRDILSGNEDGQDHDIPMGEIRSIAKFERTSSEVMLRDGGVLVLGGTNDVNDHNRGIMVETVDRGKLTIPWRHFVKVTFSDDPGSGKGRESYDNEAPLAGTVVLTDGSQASGRLVYDVDAAWNWCLFSGSDQGIEYDIPFALVSVVTILPQNRCRVQLRTGPVLELGESHDTGDGNAGILVFDDHATEPRHIPWSLVQEVRFDGMAEETH